MQDHGTIKASQLSRLHHVKSLPELYSSIGSTLTIQVSSEVCVRSGEAWVPPTTGFVEQLQ